MQSIPSQQQTQSFSHINIKQHKQQKNNKFKIYTILIIAILTVSLLLVIKYKTKSNLFIEECDIFDCNDSIKAIGKNLLNSTSQSLISSNQHYHKFNIQKIVWIYNDQKLTQQTKQKLIFMQLNWINTQQVIKQSNYTINQINKSNYTTYLSSKSNQQITHLLSTIQARIQKQINSSIRQKIKSNKQKIIKRLIIYFLILENGGVFIDNQVTLIQSFNSWIQNVINLPYINVGNKLHLTNTLNTKIEPKCLGFFINDYSSLRSKIDIRREYEFERKIVVFPTIQQYFLACQKDSQYLKRLISTYIDIILNQDKSTKLQKLNTSYKLIGKTNIQNIYQEGHIIANHIILQQHQAQLNNIQSLNTDKQINSNTQINNNTLTNNNMSQSGYNQNNQYKSLAIDDLGFITINNNLGPQKLKHLFLYHQKCFSYLSKLPLNQLQNLTGKLRFITLLPSYLKWKLGRQLIMTQLKKQQYFVQNSFFHHHFLKFLNHLNIQTQNHSLIIKKPQIISLISNPQQNLANPIWQKLPKIIWVIWDKGLKRHSKPIIELCFQNLKKSALNSGFQIKVISNQNVHQYISQQLRDKIQLTIKNAKHPVLSQAISDFWRLALIYQNGGVYVDASTFTLGQNFDWITNVTRVPSNMLWNRYGTEPQVFIFWNSFLGCPADWHIDSKYNTKSQWHLSYESNFIAAVKGSKFIKQWFQVFTQWMITPYEQIYQQMKDVDIQNYKWTKVTDRYLMVMDAVKYVVGRRQKLLLQQKKSQYLSASDYYKVWSMTGQMNGQQKFRGQTNFESRDYRLDYMAQDILNLYKYEYSWSFAQQLLGPLIYQSKFFGLDLRQMGFVLDNFYRANEQNFSIGTFEHMVHPESVFGKVLLYRDQNFTMKVMKYYNDLSMRRIELKTMKYNGL